MNNQLAMQKKSRYMAFLILICILISVATLIYLIYGMAKHIDPQSLFTGLNWQREYKDANLAYACERMIIHISIILALAFAYTIFQSIGKGLSPFSHVISERIRAIGILLIISAIIAWPVGSLAARVIWPDKTSYPIIISVDWGTLLFGFIISCLASIFQYGCILQQESDETL